MKRMKKLLAVLLAAIMVMSLGSVSVMADDANDGEYYIYINGVDSTSYSFDAYMIFSGHTTNEVLADVTWGTGVDLTNNTEETILTAIKEITVDNSTYPFSAVTSAADVAAVLTDYTDDAEIVQAFSEVIVKYLTEEATATTDSYTVDSDEKYTYTFSKLNAGYYLVKDSASSTVSAYTKYILVTAGPVAGSGATYNQISIKTSYPTVSKTADVDTVSIGDTVTYTLEGTVPELTYYDTYTYTFTDTLSSGLTYDSTSLKVYGVPIDGTDDVTLSSYTASSSSNSDGTTTITVSFSDLTTVTNISSYSKIKVVYTATLNTNAVVGTAATASNLNAVTLTYSNNPNDSTSYTTTTSTAYVTTLKLKITKTDASDGTSLEGAVFFLYYLDENDTPYYAWIDKDNNLSYWSTDATDLYDTPGYPTTDLETGSDGTITINGLGEGTYYLVEMKPADGYNQVMDAWEVEVKADVDQSTGYLSSLNVTGASSPSIYTVTSSTSDGTIYVSVTNSKNGALPTTGGIGTTIFYVVGAILVCGAGVILITRRRMASR